LIETLMFFSPKIFSLQIKKLAIYIPVIAIVISLLVVAGENGAFTRLESSFNFDSQDDYEITVATGGRWQELTGIMDHHNEVPIRWLIGAGFGGTYLWHVDLSNYSEMKHYSHFSPSSYVFIFGIPFTLLLYYFFAKHIIKGMRRLITNPFFITFVVSIFGSCFGANLFVDIKIWVFTGIVIYMLKHKTSYIRNLKM
jgi:hypothetical protein